jgi:hypothetical protein
MGRLQLRVVEPASLANQAAAFDKTWRSSRSSLFSRRTLEARPDPGGLRVRELGNLLRSRPRWFAGALAAMQLPTEYRPAKLGINSMVSPAVG